jgi:hypothetical protein
MCRVRTQDNNLNQGDVSCWFSMKPVCSDGTGRWLSDSREPLSAVRPLITANLSEVLRHRPNALAPSARMRSPTSHSPPLLQFLPATISREARQDLAIRCAYALSIGLAGKTLPSRVSASGQGSVRGRERTTGRFLSLRSLWRHTDSDPLPVEAAFCPRARVPRRRDRTYPLLPGSH